MSRRTSAMMLIALVLCGSFFVLSAPGGAQTGRCRTGVARLSCRIGDNPTGDVLYFDGPVARFRSTLQRLYDVAMGFGNVGDAAPCILGTTELDPLGQGLLYYVEVIRPSDGVTTQQYFSCVGPGESPVPPEPPTRAEIMGAVAIPQPAIHVSPAVDGLVGLDTWLWGDDHGSVSVSLTIRGWNVTGALSPVAWVFETSDGGVYSAANPGSESHPVGTHLFSRKGWYEIAHSVEWGGGFTVGGYGLTVDAGTLGTSFEASADYRVIEIEAVGTATG